MRRALLSLAIAAAALGSSLPAAAGTLRVTPVTLDLPEGQRAGLLTVVNPDTAPTAVQVRVFRWTQVNGKDELQPTTDAVVSPPATTLKPGAQHVVRVVRTSDAPPHGEESFRVLVDEVPDAATLRRGGVALVLRQSLPVFFNSPRNARAELSWSLAHDGQGWSLVARNTGQRRARLTNLEVKPAAGPALIKRDGLAGYVLSGAEMRWPLPTAPAPKAALAVSAATEAGPLHADLGLPPR